MILISNLTLNIKDGSTIASTNIYSTNGTEDKKTYINIGSGNVFKLDWETPVLTDDDNIDHYSLVIKRYDPTLNVYYDIFNKNIGLVNDFSVDSFLLPTVPEQYMLSVYIVAYGKYGNTITSNVISPYISKGSGTYIKVEEGYTQPIMKRALAFSKVVLPVLTDDGGIILKDANDNTLEIIGSTNKYTLMDSTGEPLEDATGIALIAEADILLDKVNGWAVVQDSYTKDATGTWRVNNIKYEVIVDNTGEIITDSNNEPIYVL